MTRVRKHPSGPPAADLRTDHGIGRSSSTRAERVSDALRRHDSADLTRRRRASALYLLATTALGVVEAYQMGIVRAVPEPSLPGLGADEVDASGEAYHLFGTPDAAVGIVSYGVSLVLLGAGADDRAEAKPWLPLMAAAKVSSDALGGAYLFAEQVTKHRKVCSWCTVAAVATSAALPLVLPEARRAWRALTGGRRRAEIAV